MKILIISELFYPQNEIGAVRPTKIFEYLRRNGHYVDVITKSFSDEKQVIENGNIWRIDTVKKNSSNSIAKNKIKNNTYLIKQLKQAKRTLVSIKKGRKYSNAVIKFIENKNICITNYDAVFTTFGPISSIIIGITLKKKYPSIKWICDFRDPMNVNEVSFFLKGLMGIIQKKACYHADCISAVSNGYIQRICGKKYISKRYMIPNGYDSLEIPSKESIKQDVEKIHFAYVGSLYEGKRKLAPFFRVLRELSNEKKINLGKICIDYAGNDGNFLKLEAEKYDMDKIVQDVGTLNRQECLKLQSSSHFLLLSTWNNKGEEGVFPGKFLEYILIGNPIISITEGNKSNGEVTSVMREGNFGVAYESANDKEDFLLLKNYIENSYEQWKLNRTIPFLPKKEVVDRYNYINIIKQIEGMIREK